MDIITRGLVIRQPWIEHILAGRKSWELRGKKTLIRGPIALIEGGSGLVVGTANVLECKGPLSRTDRVRAANAAQILKEEIDEDMYKEVYGWVLSDIKRLTPPIKYRHPSGAVIRVTLESSLVNQLATQSFEQARPKRGR